MIGEIDRLKAHWMVGCQASRLGSQPHGVVVLGIPLVLYRSGNSIVAAEDRCPHRNAPLSCGKMHMGSIVCPYHGWRFGEQGQCVDAPGMSGADVPKVSLRRWSACEVDGWVWVSQSKSDPTHSHDRSEPPVYRPTIADDARYQGFNMTAELDSHFADAIENLLDGTHTPFVHSGLVRSPHAKQQFTAVVRRSDHCVEAEYRGEAKQNGFISRWFEPDREASYGRFVPPCTAELEYRSRRRTELFVSANFTPACVGKVKVYVRCYLPHGRLPASLRYMVVKPFFQRVLSQDRKILQLQQWNIARFERHAYTNWTADLLRPWIDAWLATGEFPMQPDGPSEVRFDL